MAVDTLGNLLAFGGDRGQRAGTPAGVQTLQASSAGHQRACEDRLYRSRLYTGDAPREAD